MSLFNDKINAILEKTDLDANELRPGDLCLNTNKECDHYGSKGKVLKVFKLKEPDNTIGKFVRYKVLNDGPTYKKGDVLDKTEIQLKKINEQLKPRPHIKADPKELAMGIKVEKEHTTSDKAAKTIALQHLAEDPKYYSKLKKVEGSVHENYADGKVKGKSRPGRVRRSGASCKGSVTSLRAKAKKAGGEKGKMYHWCANMKGGKKKK
jgi:hypothetical protein